MKKLHNHAYVVVILLQVLAVDHDDCHVDPEAEAAFLFSGRERSQGLTLVQSANDHLHGVVPAISANPLDYIWWKHVFLLNKVIDKTAWVLENGVIPFNLHLLMLCFWHGLLLFLPLLLTRRLSSA